RLPKRRTDTASLGAGRGEDRRQGVQTPGGGARGAGGHRARYLQGRVCRPGEGEEPPLAPLHAQGRPKEIGPAWQAQLLRQGGPQGDRRRGGRTDEPRPSRPAKRGGDRRVGPEGGEVMPTPCNRGRVA